jgi:hypothetical protein
MTFNNIGIYTMNELEFYKSVCTKIEEVYAAEGLEVGAVEGLNSNIVGRMFVAICDGIGGLFKTFGTNLTRFTKSLKRSELHEFYASNTMKTRVVDKLPYEKLVEVMVDCPSNMKDTYKKAVDSLIAVYMKLNAVNTGKLVLISFREIMNSLNSGDAKLPAQADTTANLVEGIVKTAKPAIDLCMGQFSGPKMTKIPFDRAFLTIEEWVEVRNTLIANEYRLQDVNGITKSIDEMEKLLKSITSVIDVDNPPVTAKDINNISTVAKDIALIYDAYGMAATRQMALEHNYVLCVNTLYAKVR